MVGSLPQKIEKDGWFLIEGVIPGPEFSLWAWKNFRIYDQNLVPKLTRNADEVKDPGDLRRKEEPDQ